MKKKIFAYMAGVIDSDGSIHIERVTDKRNGNYQYTVRVQVQLTSKEMIEWFADKFNGPMRKRQYIYPRPASSPKRKDMYIWRISSQHAIDFLKKIEPYLLLKKPRAAVAIAMEDTFLDKKMSRNPSVVKEKKKMKEKLFQQLKILNKRGM